MQEKIKDFLAILKKKKEQKKPDNALNEKQQRLFQYLLQHIDITLQVIQDNNFTNYEDEIKNLIVLLFMELNLLTKEKLATMEKAIKKLIRIAFNLPILKKESVVSMMINLLKIDTGTFGDFSLAKLYNYSSTDLSILITGETGTGKELTAKLIHYLSNRIEKPFIAMNCGGLPTNLIESELFGIEKNTASGVSERKGYFETVKDGTLFLDEIGEMPFEMQVKVLRVLNDKQYIRVGGNPLKPQTLKARLLFATNRNLLEGDFRKDLFYRINKLEITLLPIREQLKYMSAKGKKEFFDSHVSRVAHEQDTSILFSDKAVKKLSAHGYPGNYRELENILIRAIINYRVLHVDIYDAKNVWQHIDLDDSCIEFPKDRDQQTSNIRLNISTMTLQEIEDDYHSLVAAKLKDLLKRHNGIMIDAAIETGLSKDKQDKNGRNSFRKLCIKHSINYKDYR